MTIRQMGIMPAVPSPGKENDVAVIKLLILTGP
jgi:hypothetical protein